MKTVIAAAFLVAASTTASATPMLNANSGVTKFVSAASTVLFEAANRKGSHRVGGTGRSGKGSRYVGGRK